MKHLPLPVVLGLSLLAVPGVAAADHTDPAVPLAPLESATVEGSATGTGVWTHEWHLPPNPSTDLTFWTRDGVMFGAVGTLGGGPADHVGQRILQLTDTADNLDLRWLADHGSAACDGADVVGNLRLQHDQAITPRHAPELMVDTADGPGRCHDRVGGGLEIIDVSGVGVLGGAPVREIGLTRHNGTSHTVTADPDRPWIIYNSNGDYAGMAWIDVVDVSSCLGLVGESLEGKRAACRPAVYRIPFEPDWASQRLPDGSLGDPTGCHDISVAADRLYCASLNATVMLDVTDLTTPDGAVAGTPLPCDVVSGSATTAMVTDCSVGGPAAADAIAAYEALGRPQATGWRFLGTINHPGRDDGQGGEQGLTNVRVPSREGVAISHQAEPVPAAVGPWLLVTDERGGGVSRPGASCEPGLDNPIGNGGIHVFDVSDPSAPTYALGTDGRPAVYIAEAVVPAGVYCTVHVIHHLPDEQRIITAWYTQGIRIVDYAVDPQGRWSFVEVASLRLPDAQTWAVDVFSTVDHQDGSRTYRMLAGDMVRGGDVVTWSGPRNPIPVPPPPTTPAAAPPPPPTADEAEVVPTTVPEPSTEPAGVATDLQAPSIPTPVPAGPTGRSRAVDALLLVGGVAALGSAALWGRRRRAGRRDGWSGSARG